MKIKLKPEVPLGGLSYQLKFKPHLKFDEATIAVTRWHKGTITMDERTGRQERLLTLLHEYLHCVDGSYQCNLDEAQIERLAHGMNEFLVRYLGLTFDWSEIPIEE